MIILGASIAHPILSTIYKHTFVQQYAGLQQQNQLNFSLPGGTRAHKNKLDSHEKNEMHLWSVDMDPALFDVSHKERAFLRKAMKRNDQALREVGIVRTQKIRQWNSCWSNQGLN